MELTKSDRKRIEQDANAIVDNILCAATNYAKLYECELYKAVIERIEAKIDAVEYLQEYMRNRKTGEK